MKNLIFRLYPDLTGSVSRQREFTLTPIAKSCRWDEAGAHRRMALAALGGAELAQLIGVELGSGVVDPFPCQETQKSDKREKPKRYGLTNDGRKVVRRAACVLEQTCEKGTLAFGTLTLSPALVTALFAQSDFRPSELLQIGLSRFLNSLRHRLRRKGLSGDIIWVTELHPARSQKEGVMIPHVHFVVQTALEKFRWLIKPREIERLWNVAFSGHIDVDKNTFKSGRVELRSVKKSVARYVSKYLSKSSSKRPPTATGLDDRLCPSRWYAVSNAIHKLIRKFTKVVSGEDAAVLLDWLCDEVNQIVWRHGHIKITGDSGRAVWLATWFRLSEPIDPATVVLTMKGPEMQHGC